MQQLRPLHLGLTGGIGSGKSTVASLLQALGAAVMDADAIARSVTAPGGAAMPEIARQFGDAFVQADGALDRARMRDLVFADPLAKQRLERIVHPCVGEETRRQTQTALERGHELLVFDVPLLVESRRWRQQVQRVLVIDCEPATQIQRVGARSGLAAEEVSRIIAAQSPRSVRLAAADWVIYNEGLDLPALRAEVMALGLT
jgi:dephospho-CoA kinase